MRPKNTNIKKLRIRKSLKKFNKNNRLRLSVSRSSKNISAQIIDDINRKTLVSASSVEKSIKDIRSRISRCTAKKFPKSICE